MLEKLPMANRLQFSAVKSDGHLRILLTAGFYRLLTLIFQRVVFINSMFNSDHSFELAIGNHASS